MQRSTADAPASDTSETAGAPVAATPTGDAVAGSAPADAPARGRGEPPAWLGLPPIQRITPDEPRLNLPEAFTASLAAWRDPSYLAPLGHLVGAAEPAGVLHGAAAPVSEPTRADLEPTGRPHGDDPAPLPLATPVADTGRATPSLQRQLSDPTPDRWQPSGPTSDRRQVPSPAPDRRQVSGATAQRHPAVPDPPAAPLPVRSVPVDPVPVSQPMPVELVTADQPMATEPMPVGQPVPLEPVAVSRLLTAPPPAVALHLPTVEPPAAMPQRAVDTDRSAPVDAPQAPTLGQDIPATEPISAEQRGPDVAPPEPSGSAEAPGPVASGSPQSVPDLPVQRVPAGAPRPPRRLGLGEPIMSPLLPPPEAVASVAHDLTGVRDAAPVQRSPAGADAPAPAHRPPTGASEAAAAPAAAAGGQGGVGDGPVEGTTTVSDQAGLVGEVPVSRLAADAPTTAVDPGWRHDGTEPDAAPATPVGDLPVAGTATGRAFQDGTAQAGDGAASGGDPAGSDTGGPPVQTFVPPDDGHPGEARVAPLLAQPPAPVPSAVDGGPAETPVRGGRAADPTGDREAGARGSDLPVVSRLAAPAATHPPAAGSPAAPAGGYGDAPDARVGPAGGYGDTPDARVGPAGGYGDTPDAGDDTAGGGRPDVTPAPPPLVVARLVGDRPVRLLTGDVPAAPAPARPSVQRVTWRRDEEPVPAAAASLPVSDPQPSPSSLVADVPDLPSAPAAVHSGAPTGTGPAVQRWVGTLPGSPPPLPPGGTGSGGDSPPMAYLGGGPMPAATAPGRNPPAPIVQRAEPDDTPPPAEAPPPADVPPPADAPGPAATPPSDGRPAAAGQPAAPGGPPAGGPEPEELLKKLYDPLLRRLKTELRLDRERHGVLGGPG
ncbi:hypothetical protein [Micromonospora eburnea]|uniref:hypothetical protein n=1 Tax=Micromonospora eburnea TaxID=227316 RepID=UPI00114C95BA|nr:hypothetical protein [Micromonospora eburnea]